MAPAAERTSDPGSGEDNRKLDLEQELPIPANLPFILTGAQEKAVGKYLMIWPRKLHELVVGRRQFGQNRSGGNCYAQTIKAGWNVALIAPTRY